MIGWSFLSSSPSFGPKETVRHMMIQSKVWKRLHTYSRVLFLRHFMTLLANDFNSIQLFGLIQRWGKKVHVVHLWEMTQIASSWGFSHSKTQMASASTSYEDDQTLGDLIQFNFTQHCRFRRCPVSYIDFQSFVSFKAGLEVQWAGKSKSSPC